MGKNKNLDLKRTVTVFTDGVKVGDILDALIEDLTQDEIVEAVQHINDMFGDWDFSYKLYKRALKDRKIHDAEVRNDANKGFYSLEELWEPTKKERKKIAKIKKAKKADLKVKTPSTGQFDLSEWGFR